MKRSAVELAIRACLIEISGKLGAANASCEAAVTCAEKGNLDRAIDIALDVEQPIYEASRLLDAASLLKRLSRSEQDRDL